MKLLRERLFAATLLFCVTFASVEYAKANPNDETANIDFEVDTVLNFIRSDEEAKKILNNIAVPLTLQQDGVNIGDLKLSNLVNLFRDGNATLSVINNSLVANLTIEVKDLTMDAGWWKKVVFENFTGTVGCDFASLTVRTVLTIQALNVSLTEFTVTSIGYITVTKFTGASVLSSLVKKIVQTLLNQQSFKNQLTTTIEQQAQELFHEIFGSLDWLKKQICKSAGPMGGIRLE